VDSSTRVFTGVKVGKEVIHGVPACVDLHVGVFSTSPRSGVPGGGVAGNVGNANSGPGMLSRPVTAVGLGRYSGTVCWGQEAQGCKGQGSP